MKIYIALIEDRHIDVEVKLFLDLGVAIQYAKDKAQEYSSDPLNMEDIETEDWLFCRRYGCEGDFVRVVEAELQ